MLAANACADEKKEFNICGGAFQPPTPPEAS